MNEIAGMVLACMGTLTPVEIHLEIWSSHEYLSACHVALTERGFDYPKQQCFCAVSYTHLTLPTICSV